MGPMGCVNLRCRERIRRAVGGHSDCLGAIREGQPHVLVEHRGDVRRTLGKSIGTSGTSWSVVSARPARYRHVWGRKSRLAKGSRRLETTVSIAESMTYRDLVDRHTTVMPPRKAQIVPVKCTLGRVFDR